MYNWQQIEWANFTYNHLETSKKTADSLDSFDEMNCVLEGLNTAEQQNELVEFMISEALKTSEIEGELISRQDLRSSIRNRLGLNASLENVKDRRAAAVSNMLVAVRNSFSEKLTESAIKQWHKLLFENSKHINAGKWRTGNEPMQIVSGAMGREIVHYEAPPAYRVSAEMKQFVKWYNSFKISNKNTDPIIKTAISHLYFESIHPFEDGNGRIGRAIAEKCLAQSLGKPVLLSLSTTIEKNKKQYYDCLEKSQSSLDITEWILFFA
ncbi:MAG: DUF4172 domain-containing protein, partial [Prevotella sp.]|nr:DUF4172 domain-containing protein [Prevotella sp.]